MLQFCAIKFFDPINKLAPALITVDLPILVKSPILISDELATTYLVKESSFTSLPIKILYPYKI